MVFVRKRQIQKLLLCERSYRFLHECQSGTDIYLYRVGSDGTLWRLDRFSLGFADPSSLIVSVHEELKFYISVIFNEVLRIISICLIYTNHCEVITISLGSERVSVVLEPPLVDGI